MDNELWKGRLNAVDVFPWKGFVFRSLLTKEKFAASEFLFIKLLNSIKIFGQHLACRMVLKNALWRRRCDPQGVHLIYALGSSIIFKQ